MYTRQDYLDNKCTLQEYYLQFVTPNTEAYLMESIGKDAIVSSTDEYLNDIHLYKWDRLPIEYNKQAMTDAGDYLTEAGHVCIYKALAKKIRDDYNETRRQD